MEPIVKNPARAVRLLLFEVIKRDDPVLNQLAAEALTAIGPDVVHTLMAEALVADNVPYRLRLLGIVEEIGEVPEPGDHLELFNLVRDQDARVRMAAARVIHAVGLQRPQHSPLVVAASTIPGAALAGGPTPGASVG